jgi:hypothetical protein
VEDIYICYAVVNKVKWCKLDLKKAYDHVSWDFLLYLLGMEFWGEIAEVDCHLHTYSSVQWCKLDLEKAYDHVSWGFLLYLLGRSGGSGLAIAYSSILYPG